MNSNGETRARSMRFWYEADTTDGVVEGTFTLGRPFALARSYAQNVADTLARLKIVSEKGLPNWRGKARIIRYEFQEKAPGGHRTSRFMDAEKIKSAERADQQRRGILP